MSSCRKLNLVVLAQLPRKERGGEGEGREHVCCMCLGKRDQPAS